MMGTMPADRHRHLENNKGSYVMRKAQGAMFWAEGKIGEKLANPFFLPLNNA